MIEVCAYSLESCLIAQRAGAGRIELCGGMPEGGTTPSAGLIRLARKHLHIPLFVMIRPRGSDFLYTDDEFAVMQADIDVARSLGVDGVVLGILNADGTIDEVRTRQLIEYARPMPVTFHRAFDMTPDAAEALEAVVRTGAIRILTSAQQATAQAGIPLLGELVKQAAGRIEIMAGAGVNAENAGPLWATGVDALHTSGSVRHESGMQFRQPAVSMASATPGEYERVEADEDKIRAITTLRPGFRQ